MSKEKLRQNKWLTALTAGFLGTLTTLFGSNAAKKKEPSPENKGAIFNKKMILGGIAGGMVGAAAALLLAPKSGSELLKGLSNPLSRYLKKQAAAPLKKSTLKRKKSIRSLVKKRSASVQHKENGGAAKKTVSRSKQKKRPKTQTKAVPASA